MNYEYETQRKKDHRLMMIGIGTIVLGLSLGVVNTLLPLPFIIFGVGTFIKALFF